MEGLFKEYKYCLKEVYKTTNEIGGIEYHERRIDGGTVGDDQLNSREYSLSPD